MPWWLLIPLAILGPLKTQRRKEYVMFSLVLLNKDGGGIHKLHLAFLPDDFVVPEGKIISLKMDFHISSSDPLAGGHCHRPVEAYFYLGEAYGQVCRDGFKFFETDENYRTRFGCYDLHIIIQGTSAKDVMSLRNHIMELINSGRSWQTINNLNLKPSRPNRLQRLKHCLGF